MAERIRIRAAEDAVLTEGCIISGVDSEGKLCGRIYEVIEVRKEPLFSPGSVPLFCLARDFFAPAGTQVVNFSPDDLICVVAKVKREPIFSSDKEVMM